MAQIDYRSSRHADGGTQYLQPIRISEKLFSSTIQARDINHVWSIKKAPRASWRVSVASTKDNDRKPVSQSWDPIIIPRKYVTPRSIWTKSIFDSNKLILISCCPIDLIQANVCKQTDQTWKFLGLDCLKFCPQPFCPKFLQTLPFWLSKTFTQPTRATKRWSWLFRTSPCFNSGDTILLHNQVFPVIAFANAPSLFPLSPFFKLYSPSPQLTSLTSLSVLDPSKSTAVYIAN